MYKIKDITTARRYVLEGAFQGVIQTHKVNAKEKRLENDPREFLNITYPSSAIRRTIERVGEKLSKKSHQGGFLLVGPYGSGKSHTLITLYHIFKNPSLAKSWGKQWNIDVKLPKKSRSIIVSTRRYDAEHLWEPIFKLLGREDMLDDIKRFPTTDQIEELIGNDVVAIFIDEIENWYGSFDPEKEAHVIEQNETFLEHLLEVAADPSKKLFVFITFLEEKEGLKKIFNRTKPIRIDVSPIEDREKVILYRLFENIDNLDAKKVETVVERYVDAYSEPIKIDFQEYKRKMMRAYPFHPLLLSTLFQIYEAATERQDVRGMLNVLADAVKCTYDKKDIVLVSDVDENAFRGIDLKLIEKYEFDLERVKDIGLSMEILKAVLIFTLNEKTRGATESDILLSVFRPTEGHTLNSILMDLENIYGKAHYIHKEGNTYLFKRELNIYALLEKEKDKVDEESAREKASEILRKDVFENMAFIYGFDEVPDYSKIKIVAIPESWGLNGELKSKINEFYKGREWQNTIILVLPEVNTIFTFEILEKCKRLKAAENLLNQVKGEEGKLKRVVQEERKSIADKLKKYYGYIVKWIERDGELIYRLINTNADISAIMKKVQSDPELCADYIASELEDKPSGMRIEDIIESFKRYRRYPFILDDEVVYAAIRNLHRDKRIIIQGERGKMYVEEIPRNIEPSFFAIHPKYAPIEEDETDGSDKNVEKSDKDGQDAELEEIVAKRKEKKVLHQSGNSPRVILSQIEARTSEKDEFEEIIIKYKFTQRVSKQKIMEMVKQIPHQEGGEIEAELVLWREKDET